MKKLLLLAFVVLGISAVSFGQVGETKTATSSATIVTPISLTKVTDMNFGNVAVNATAGGTVVLTPAGTRTATGGVTAATALAGTITAAVFTVNGDNNHTFSITLPSGNHEIKHGTSDVMQVSAFTSTPSGTGTLTSGTQTLQIGATLNVGAAQAPGLYTSTTPFEVKVDYN